MKVAENICFRLAQEIVCERDRVCQRCGNTPYCISGHHVFGRRNHSTAFEPDACLGLCVSCHDGWARKCPQEAKDMLRAKIGEERYIYLEALSRETVRLREPDFKAIAVELSIKLERMRGKV